MSEAGRAGWGQLWRWQRLATYFGSDGVRTECVGRLWGGGHGAVEQGNGHRVLEWGGGHEAVEQGW